MGRAKTAVRQKKTKDKRMLCPCGDFGRRILTCDTPLFGAEEFFDPTDESLSVGICGECAGNVGCAVRIFPRAAGEQTTLFRVLYRTAAEHSVTVIIPEVVLPSEVEQVREWAAAARQSLADDCIPYGKLKAGIAIETPSAAILADLLAPMVDFFVIDADALMEKLHVHGLDPAGEMPESVRRCVRMTCAAARREGIPVLAEE